MRRYFALFAFLVLAGCNDSSCTSDCITVDGDGPTIHGSGKMQTETRPVGPFSAVQVLSAGKVSIERTGGDSLTLTGDDKLLALFTSTVKDGTLYLSYVKGKAFEGKMPTYHITVANLRAISINDAGSVDATKLESDALSLAISGAGRIRAAGRANALTVSVSGAGLVDASELQAKSANVVLSGVGNADVNASETLDAKITGVGRLQYIGSPKITSQISGVGKLVQKK